MPASSLLTLRIFITTHPWGSYEYIKISLAIIPEEITAQYNLLQLASNGWVYLDIRKGMPGLKQDGRIANDRLNIHLANLGYSPVALTSYLLKHANKDI